jgi:hypothetical protein
VYAFIITLIRTVCPAYLILIFNGEYTVALGSTEPLTEMSTRNLPGGKGRPERKADNLTAICEPVVYKTWQPQRLTILLASTTCYRDIFTFLQIKILAEVKVTFGKFDYCVFNNPHNILIRGIVSK